MALSRFTSPAAHARFERQYRDTMAALWPVPYTSLQASTRYGSTHVVVSGPSGGAPMVLLHAAGTTAALWHRQVGHLSATHRVYALDILGDIGLSQQTRALRTRTDAADWLADVLRALGLTRPIFVGASYGGFLATNLAVRAPACVGGLALLAPAATLQPFRPVANLMIRMGSLLPLPFTVAPALRRMLSGTLPDARFVALMEAGVRSFRYEHGGVYPSMLDDGELARVTCPVLLVLGADEVIYDPNAALARAARLWPSAQTMLLDGHGHLPGVQSPELVDARVLRFVDETLARAAD